MGLSKDDIESLFLTAKLASVVTLLLLVLSMPLAWWLSRAQSRARDVVASLVSLPLVLPPSVLGFYLLLAMGPKGPLGKVCLFLGMNPLPFTFSGLVVASLFYSLPFMVQPLQTAFCSVGRQSLEVAATLGASPLNAFFTVVVPMTKRGIVAACVMTFAHTVGEFGVVLMIGGSLPGITQVASVQIFNHVESMEYGDAHGISFVLLAFSFVAVLATQIWTHAQKEAKHG